MPTARKPRRRNTEKRKEKSRDAARCRRGKEAEIFSDICAELPVAPSTVEQLDKTSVMRLAISHLKLRTLFNTDSRGHLVKDEQDIQYLKAMDGFILLMDSEGEILYVSDNVNKYLGLSQVDLMGQSVFDFSHPCDHDEVRDTLSGPEDGVERVFFMRIKCTLTSKGRNVNLKSATYKVIRCAGYFQCTDTTKLNLQLSASGGAALKVMALTCSPVPHPSNIETPLDNKTFLSRHNMNMKFTHVDDRVEQLLGYSATELMNKSVYEYHHAMDSAALEKSYNNLFSKGQTETGMYRFLAKHGGYVWVQTQATVIYNSKSEKPEYVVCVNYVISGIEDADNILSAHQMEALSVFNDEAQDSGQGHTFVLSTQSILAEDNQPTKLTSTELSLKDTFQELASRAPAAGDTMIPLDIIAEDEILSEKLDFLGELYEGTQQEMPFMMSLNRDNSPSPITVSTVDSPDSTGAVLTPPPMAQSPVDVLPHISSADSLTLPDSLLDEMDDIALELRAPYIPMNDDEDLVFSSSPIPLLDEDDITKNMLGTTESVFAEDPEEQKANKQPEPIPMNILKQLAQDNAIRMPGKDVARNAGPPKMKRPMETNRLETGPPAAKRVCLNDTGFIATTSINTHTTAHSPPQVTQQPVFNVSAPALPQGAQTDVSPAPAGNPSVLMNLLCSGHDNKYGYNVPSKEVEQQKASTTIKQMIPVVQQPVQQATQIQRDTVPIQQQIVSSTQPTVSTKRSPLISLLRPATIQQLIQARLSANGQGNIPIRLVLPRNTVVQPNSQLAYLLQAIPAQEEPVVLVQDTPVVQASSVDAAINGSQ